MHNRYVCLPCGSSILIIDTETGQKLTALEGEEFHDAALILCVEPLDSTCYKNHFVSLDNESRVCVWEFHDLNEASSFFFKVHGRFSINNLILQQTPHVLFNSLTIQNIFSSQCHFKETSLETLTIILFHSCHSCSTLKSQKQSFSYEDKNCEVVNLSEEDVNGNDHHGSTCVECQKNLIEIVEISLCDVFNYFDGKSGCKLNVTCLFYCTPKQSLSKKNITRRSVLKTCVSPFFIALVKDYTLCVYNRQTQNVYYILHNNTFSSLTLDQSGHYLVTGDTSGNVIWWHIFCLRPNFELTTHLPGTTESLQTRFTVHSYTHTSTYDVSLHMLTQQSVTTTPQTASSFLPVEIFDIPVSVQHWHSHAVHALTFTSNNLYLVSAGEEGVLVYWHVHQSSRYFMPRFGAPIHTLACASNRIALTLADNSLRLVDTLTFTLQSAYFGLFTPLSLLLGGSLLPVSIRTRKCDCIPMTFQFYSPSSPHLALILGSGVTSDGLGANSKIQCYDFESNQCLGFCNVNQQNYISRTDTTIKKFQWTLQNACMAPSGLYLATVEFRKSMFPTEYDCLKNTKPAIHGSVSFSQGGQMSQLDRQIRPSTQARETCLTRSHEDYLDNHSHWSGPTHSSGKHYLLKFWSIAPLECGTGISSSTLLSEINFPHSHDITKILTKKSMKSFEGTILFDFITCSLDGLWKVWSIKKSTETSPKYSLQHSGHFRTLPCLSAALCQDESILCIIHFNCISIWDATHYTLGRVLGLPRSHTKFSIPQLTSLAWLECSFQPSLETLQGDLLLIAKTSCTLLLWDFQSISCPLLKWSMPLPKEHCTSILLHNQWECPLFGLYCSLDASLIMYQVVRHGTNRIECQVKHKLNLSCFTPILLNVSLCGSVLKPTIGILDTNFTYNVYDLKPFFQKSLSSNGESLPFRDNLNMMECTVSRSSLLKETEQDERMEANTQKSRLFSETTILSSFLQKCQPTTIAQTNISRYVSFIVNQKALGTTMSHLAGTPSLFFNRMVHLYTEKQVPTLHSEDNI
ncbi:uncharacterized protein LOC128883728 isoform X2 [Hylaeus volcanicus]|uniref:uncharacterized protein LOC128883728 isoform X2 n=1 Tax=Hylaeus volcanicus TaxID=313075 RepID=UPI0023B871F9|nr:uncharacterized protein LOC128883728 isoform X2 [Hylaeus volcanicus]